MAHSKIRAGAAALVGLALVALGVAGCAPAFGVDNAPVAGECWVTTYSGSFAAPNWVGKPAVACSAKHETYTYAVPKLGGTLPASAVTANGYVPASISNAAIAACGRKQKALGITDFSALFEPIVFIPSTSQWAAGACWARCDMSLIAVGSSVAHPQLAPLPSFRTVLATLKSTPKRYQLCEDDPDLNGPQGDGTVYANCLGPSDWALVGFFQLAGAPGTPYPGVAAVKKQAHSLCASVATPKGHTVEITPPTEHDWTVNNIRAVDCWLNNN